MYKLFVILAVFGATSASWHSSQGGYADDGYGYGATIVKKVIHRDPVGPPTPYEMGYDIVDGYGNKNTRRESGDAAGNKVGSYSLNLADGRKRIVEYRADKHGFRAYVKTNEPGTDASEDPADVGVEPLGYAPVKKVVAPAPSYGYTKKVVVAPVKTYTAVKKVVVPASSYAQTTSYRSGGRGIRGHGVQYAATHSGGYASGHGSSGHGSSGYGSSGYGSSGYGVEIAHKTVKNVGYGHHGGLGGVGRVGGLGVHGGVRGLGVHGGHGGYGYQTGGYSRSYNRRAEVPVYKSRSYHPY